MTLYHMTKKHWQTISHQNITTKNITEFEEIETLACYFYFAILLLLLRAKVGVSLRGNVRRSFHCGLRSLRDLTSPPTPGGASFAAIHTILIAMNNIANEENF